MNAVLAGVVIYIALQFAIGWWVSRRISTEADYVVANRSLGPALGAFSVFATWFGAEAIVGTGGTVYEKGLVGGTVDPFGYALALVIVGLVIAAPLWRRGYLTFGDFFRDRFSPGVERLAVLLILPGPIIWGAAQIRAFGQVMSSTAEMTLFASITLAAIVVVVYTVMGGLLADALTDVVQGLVIVIGLGIIAGIVVADLGGPAALAAKIEPARLAYFSSSDGNLLALAEKWAVPIFGTMVSIELLSRVLATRSPATARQACVIGGIMYLTVGLIPVLLGLVGPHLMPGLAEPEQLIGELAKAHLPTVLYIIFVGAVISAILSTVDSILLSGGAVLSHNFIQRTVEVRGEGAKLLLARASVILLGMIAYGIALRSTTIHELVETASAVASSGLIVATVFGLFTRWGGPASAYAAMIVGTGAWAILRTWEITEAPYIAAIVLAIAAYAVAAFGRKAAIGALNDTNDERRGA